jgi:hypothetical protein
MIDERGLVALLYRADWRELSLSGEVRGGREPWTWVVSDLGRLRPGGPFPPFPPFPKPGSFAETDATLLIEPGRRYRMATADGRRARGCDGERAWGLFGELPPGTEIHFGGDLEPPLPELLEPSWLLSGYDLAIEGDATACGRAAIRVVATARGRDRDRIAAPLLRWPPAMRADRVDALVDAEFGILLRCESQRGERAPDVTEFLSLTVPAEAGHGPGQFTAPPGSVFSEGSSPWPVSFPFGGAGREIAKTAAGLAAAGLGAVIKCTSRRPDPFARATEEAADPDAVLPRDDGPAPDGPPGPGAPSVSDQVLHLLYRSGADQPRFTATLHEWIDGEALLDAVPDSARKTGFGGVGFLVDAIRGTALDPATAHQVSSVRIGGWDRYRIDVTGPPQATRPRSGPGRDSRRGPGTDACDGQRRWQVYEDKVVEAPAAPLPVEVRGLADGSWLLGAALSGEGEITVGGRRAYRVACQARHRNPWPVLSVLDFHSLPAVAIVDAESGRLLRLTRYAGGKPVACRELRDIEPDESDDFEFEPPAGLPVAEEPDEQPPGQPVHPAGFAVKAAADAARGFLGSLRGTWR